MAEAAAPFFWGSGGERLTPAQIAKRRQVEEALAEKGSDYSPVQHWTQGLARVSNALVGALSEKKTAAAERANSAEDAGLLKGLLGGMGGSSAPSVGMPASPTSAGASAPSVTPDIKNGIVQTASALGIDPVDLATTISYETAGTFDPTKRGPTTQWGQHRGLIQFGEPQAREHGVDWTNPVGSQLGPDGAVASYLRKAGVQPGMGLLDIYSAINAGAPGLYNRSDAKNGGAPGTVRDKVEQQMQGHRAKAQALLSAQADMPAPGAAPVEAPAGQPGFAVPPAEAPQPLPMSPQNFAAITSGEKPLDPVFQSEGVSQPWMGTALAPQQVTPQVAQAPMPPARPADLPAPGAVEAIGQMPPQQPAPANMGNIDHFGDRLLQVQSEEARQGQPSAPQAAGSTLERVMAAFTGGGQPAPASAPQSPAVAKVAQAVAQNPGDPIVQALTSPYSSDATKRVAMAMLTKKIESQTRPQWSEQTLPDGSLAQRNSQTGEMKIIRPGVNPLDAEGKKLDIETKKKNLGKAEAPTVQRVKQPDGSEVAVQWDQASGSWVPLKAPEGGNAVKAPGKLTEQQSKDVGFYNRGSKIVDRLDTQDAALKDTLSALGGNVSNYLKSDSYRQAEQTGRELLAVILRKDTGAAVTDKEMELYGNIYLPKPGDDDQTVMQKRFARRNAMEGLKMGLGPAEILFNSQNTPMPAQKGAAPSGQTKSGVKWSVE